MILDKSNAMRTGLVDQDVRTALYERGAIVMLPETEVRMPFGFSIRLATNDHIPRNPSGPSLRGAGQRRPRRKIRANDAELHDLGINYFRGGGCVEVVEDATAARCRLCGLRPLTPAPGRFLQNVHREIGTGARVGKATLEDLLDKLRRGGFREVWLETNSCLPRPSPYTGSTSSSPSNWTLTGRNATWLVRLRLA